jgi:hypothetical protein
MNKTIGLVLVLALMAGACGDDDAGAIDNCDDAADATIALVQDVITELEAMSPSDFGRMTQEGTADFPAFVAIEARGVEIGAKVEALACTDIDAMVAERADQLQGDPTNGFTQLIIDGTRNGEDVLGRLFR